MELSKFEAQGLVHMFQNASNECVKDLNQKERKAVYAIISHLKNASEGNIKIPLSPQQYEKLEERLFKGKVIEKKRNPINSLAKKAMNYLGRMSSKKLIDHSMGADSSVGSFYVKAKLMKKVADQLKEERKILNNESKNSSLSSEKLQNYEKIDKSINKFEKDFKSSKNFTSRDEFKGGIEVQLKSLKKFKMELLKKDLNTLKSKKFSDLTAGEQAVIKDFFNKQLFYPIQQLENEMGDLRKEIERTKKKETEMELSEKTEVRNKHEEIYSEYLNWLNT